MSNASGDDEELKEALDTLERVSIERHDPDICQCRSVARKSVESLFERIKEERDRPEAECLMELLHEPTGKMLPVRVRTVVQALESELGRIKEAALTPEEVAHLMGNPSVWPFRVMVEDGCPYCKSIVGKFEQISQSRISGGALKEGATQ